MDILFFAAIAFYIFWKLREQFGKMDEDEKRKIHENITKKKELILSVQKQISNTSKKTIEDKEIQKKIDEKFISSLKPEVRDAFRKIITDSNISAEKFIESAKDSFENVIKSFASGDLIILKNVLSQKVFEVFQSTIKEREEKKQKVFCELIKVEKIEVEEADFNNSEATIKLTFFSKQINYICDSNEEIITGSKIKINNIVDSWTFQKNNNSTNKNWVIYLT
jgi:predicted lipid-binding transport protein (Tim44 family)